MVAEFSVNPVGAYAINIRNRTKVYVVVLVTGVTATANGVPLVTLETV